jgi:hypothetical protein
VARVVFTISEEQDEISGGVMIRFTELVKTRTKDSIEDGRSTSGVGAAHRGFADPARKSSLIARPRFDNSRNVAEVFDEGKISFWPKQPLNVLGGNSAVMRNGALHRDACIKEDTGSDGRIPQGLEGKNFAGQPVVVVNDQITRL